MQQQSNNKNIVDLIINNISISSYIGQYISLIAKGPNYSGLCPFHLEKTPSFTVNNDKKFFYCFGCKETGNIVQFAIKYHNINYKEALEKLAQYAGITLDEYTYKKISRRELLLRELKEINNKVALLYHNAIKDNDKPSLAMDYLKNRFITPTSIQEFMLGEAPSTYHFIRQKIDLKKYSDQAIEKSQIFIKLKDSHDYFDRFREKIIFPIHNIQGEIIAFGSRVLDNSLPKYIHSPQTLLFNKRETLYGIFQAKTAIKERQNTYITEGYFDVIAMHQYGFKNTVGTLGTALTQQHLYQMKNLNSQITLLFDGDYAGEKATLKALFMALSEEITTHIVITEENKDPYDIAFTYKDNLYQFLEKNTKTWENYLIYTIEKEKNPIKQQQLVKSYIMNLDGISTFLSQFFSEHISSYFQIPIERLLENPSSPYMGRKSYKRSFSHLKKEKGISPHHKEKITEETFVSLAIFYPNDFYHIQKELNLSSAFFRTKQAKELFLYFSNQNNFILEEFIQTLPENLKELLQSYKDSVSIIENKAKALKDCYYSLQILALLEQEKLIKLELSTKTTPEDIALYFKELEILNKKKKNLEQKMKN